LNEKIDLLVFRRVCGT